MAIEFDLTPMVEKGFSVSELARGWMVLLYTVLILLNGSMLVYLYCCTVAILLISRFSRFLILLNYSVLLYLYCCTVAILLICRFSRFLLSL